MNVLLTGASGFVGENLTRTILKQNRFNLISIHRKPPLIVDHPFKLISSISANNDWSSSLKNVDVVVHAAAKLPSIETVSTDSLLDFRSVNVAGTLNLAKQAAMNGVKRFVFLSSIKVNGEQTVLGHPFSADDTPAPEDAYGISKWEAEQGLQQLAYETAMEVVIIRPPLVYGPGVKGNFASLMKLVAIGLPLPLGAIHNQRSLVALDNLLDLIITCIDHPAAANQVFLAGDGQDLSTTDLFREIARVMAKPSRLIPMPHSMLMFCSRLLGKSSVSNRLLGSLQVDISKARDLLGWEPPISVEEGLRRCIEYQEY